MQVFCPAIYFPKENTLNRTVQFVIGLFSLILALAAGFYGRNLYLKEVSTYQVPVPIHPISAYTVLKAEMFQMREMPRSMESLPYYQSVQDLNGKLSTIALTAGLPVAQASAVSPMEFRLADPEFEVISIPVEPVSAVGGQIRIGDRVNLYQVIAETTNADQVETTFPAFSVEQIAASVLVVDVRTAQGLSASTNQTNESAAPLAGSNQNEQVQILTLSVKPEMINIILQAVATGKKQGGLLWTTLALP